MWAGLTYVFFTVTVGGRNSAVNERRSKFKFLCKRKEMCIVNVSPDTSPKHPASCIEPGLAIYITYDNIHVSMLFSQIISPSPSPTGPTVCSLHLCLLCCLAYRVIVTIFLNSIYRH